MDNIIFQEINQDLELVSFCTGAGVYAFCALEDSMYIYHTEKEFQSFFKSAKDKNRYLKTLAKSLGFKRLEDLFIKTVLIGEDECEYEIYLCADRIVMATAYDENHTTVLFDSDGKRKELLVRSSIIDILKQI